MHFLETQVAHHQQARLYTFFQRKTSLFNVMQGKVFREFYRPTRITSWAQTDQQKSIERRTAKKE